MRVALIPGLPSVGGSELIVLLVIILLLFGASRIPELAKGLGSGVREFKRGVRGDKDEELAAGEEEPLRAEQAERSGQKH